VWCVAQPTWAWAPAETREPDLAHQGDGEVVPALSTANGREWLRAVWPVPPLTPQQAPALGLTPLGKRARSTRSRLRCHVQPHDAS
jgi:hypothetical protein